MAMSAVVFMLAGMTQYVFLESYLILRILSSL